MIELVSVSKAYRGAAAVENLSLAVPAGRTTVLLGPSGCGKSTLLRLMLGLIRPDAGEVRLFGEPLTEDNTLAQRRRIGYVVQDGGLFPHLTARKNVSLVADLAGWPADKVNGRVKELIALARLPNGAIDRYPAQLSGGQRQRVGLMRALMLDPSVLLLDEPMGALDPLVRADLQADLKQAFRDLGKSVVLVTHDLREAATLGDLIVLMHSGRIAQQGTLADLRERPADPFVTRFLTAQEAA